MHIYYVLHCTCYILLEYHIVVYTCVCLSIIQYGRKRAIDLYSIRTVVCMLYCMLYYYFRSLQENDIYTIYTKSDMIECERLLI
jgi:hypothetical protein